jgi:DNA polymerase III epsilon subunit-like protein
MEEPSTPQEENNIQQTIFGDGVTDSDSDSDEEGSNELSDPPSPDNSNPNPVNTNSIPKKEKVNYTVPPTTGTTGSTVFFVFDVETTGPSRQYNKIIEISFLAIRAENNNIEEGKVVGTFKSRCANGRTPISHAAFRVHGITANSLAGESDFSVVGGNIISFMHEHITENDTGVLVAHNGNSTNFQYLAIKLMRHGLEPPEQIQFTLDTYYICQCRFPARLYKNITLSPRAPILVSPALPHYQMYQFLLDHPVFQFFQRLQNQQQKHQ